MWKTEFHGLWDQANMLGVRKLGFLDSSGKGDEASEDSGVAQWKSTCLAFLILGFYSLSR
jgi:hypothetical protein